MARIRNGRNIEKLEIIQVPSATLTALSELDKSGASKLHQLLLDTRWGRRDIVQADVSLLAREFDGTQGFDLVHEAALIGGNKTTARLCSLISSDKAGDQIDDRKAGSVEEAAQILRAHLRTAPRGWIFNVAKNGFLDASAALSVGVQEDEDEGTKYLILTVMFNDGLTFGGYSEKNNGIERSHSVRAADVRGKTGQQILDLFGYFIGDDDMIDDYDAQTEYQDEIVSTLTSQQFVMTGIVEAESDSLFYTEDPDNRHNDNLRFRKSINRSGDESTRKVILCDSEGSMLSGRVDTAISLIAERSEEDDQPELVSVPSHHLVRVFDTKTLTYLYVHSNSIEEYEYNDKITEQIVLPESHRDLLDVLTSDMDSINEDIIEGKGGGTMVLCKGKPGLGKTLTAEAYSEITHRPLLGIQSGVMGTKPRTIRENLRIAFDLARKFNAILLLDEADVFILKRGNSLVQNAVVAEFLIVLEYFDGLLFMTTNRSDDIDDAIESRSAAMIEYTTPKEDEIRRTWQVFADLFEAPLDKKTLDGLVKEFPDISPRSIKMLFRLTLRYVRKHDIDLDLDVFKRMSVFRSLD